MVSGVQNLLYSAISEMLLGRRPGLEGEQNLAVWRTGIANGKLFLMLLYHFYGLSERDIVTLLLGSSTSVVIFSVV